jgi:hypothetical protein
VALGIMAAVPAPASAQYYPNGGYGRSGGYDRVAYDNGYRDGLRSGEEDGSRGRGFNYSRHSEYRRADGHNDRLGNRGQYQQVYRRGFEEGYRYGYDRVSGRGGSARPRDSRYPDRYGYPGSRNPDSGGYGYGYRHPAFERGYSEGYEQGVEDARDRDRFDPMRHGRYRSADRGYNSRYGSKDEYKNAYRAGWRDGYEQGYREVNGYRNGGYSSGRNTRRAPWWLPF